jgi:hypothetical protein
MPTDPFFDNYAHLTQFPDHILRDLGRNDAAPHDYRKQAVELLVVRKSPFAKHEDLRRFVEELNVELDGVEFEHPPQTPTLRASVTTATMFGGETIDMEALRQYAASLDQNTKFTGFDFEIPPPSAPVPSQPKKPRQSKPKEPDDVISS